MGNYNGVPFVGGDPAEEALTAQWRVEVAFGNSKNVGGRIGFLELLAPLLNHVVRDYVEILARDSDSARLHAGNNHGEGFPGAHEVVEESAAFDHDAPCAAHLIGPRNDGGIQPWKGQVPAVVDAEAVGVE